MPIEIYKFTRIDDADIVGCGLEKVIFLDNGIGDHIAFLHVLPDIIKKYKNITIACCYKNVFWEFPEIKLIGLGEGEKMIGERGNKKQNVYGWMRNHQWTKSIISAYREMYNV
jgi:hypothetical protein